MDLGQFTCVSVFIMDVFQYINLDIVLDLMYIFMDITITLLLLYNKLLIIIHLSSLNEKEREREREYFNRYFRFVGQIKTSLQQRATIVVQWHDTEGCQLNDFTMLLGNGGPESTV